MKKNMGNIDRTIRSSLAIIFIVLFLTETLTGVTGIVLLVLAIVFGLTSLIGYCPLYKLFGITTCTRQQA